MSESSVVHGMEHQAAGGSAAGVTAGMLLRDARQAAGVHVAALAVALKVPVAKLEALEADHLEVFPDAVFVRALASSVCRTLKVDPAPVLALLPSGTPPRLSADKGINTAFKDGGGKAGGAPLGASGSKSVVVAVMVLLLAALALVFMPRGTGDGASASGTAADGAVPVSETGTVRPEPVAVSVPESVPASIASAPVAVAASGPAVVAAPVTGEGASVAAAPASVPVTALPSADGVLVIRARADSWVQVRSVTGGAAVQRLLKAGESMSAPGSAPWSVVIGKADATEVIVRGQAMDLSGIARENVARFEVK